MRKIIVTILLFIPLLSWTQQRFSKTYDYGRSSSGIPGAQVADLAVDLIEEEDGTFIFPTSSIDRYAVDTIDYAVSYFQLFKTDSAGNILFHKAFRMPRYYLISDYICKIDSGYLIGGFIIDLVKSHQTGKGFDLLLVKVSLTGDTLWTKVHSLQEGDDVIKKMIRSKDGGIIVTGWTCINEDKNCNIFLAKFDVEGNLLWDKKYVGKGTLMDGANSCVEDDNGNIYIAGHTRSPKDLTMFGFLLKTDKYGNELRRTYWGDSLGSDFHHAFKDVLLSRDGSIIVCGYGDTDYSYSEGIVVKMDTNMRWIWKKKFGRDSDRFESIFERNGKLYITGNSYDYVEAKMVPWVMCLNEQGKMLWENKYKNFDSTLTHSTVYTARPTQDGDIILVGTAGTKTHFLQFNQNAWLMKLDSSGCLYDGCNITGIEKKFDETILSLYPNPASSEINIVSNDPVLSYHITDLLGRTLIEESFMVGSKIDVSNLMPSTYIIRVKFQSGEYAFEKLIIE